MAAALPFLVAILLLQSCIALLNPTHCFHHHRPPLQSSKCREPSQIYVAEPNKSTDTSSPPTQPKKRRRKADSFFLTNNIQSTNNESPRSEEQQQPEISPLVETPPEATQSQKCPLNFAMTFKRYRVDLSNDKSASNDPESEKRRSRRLQKGIINKLVNNLGGRGDKSSKESSEGKNNPWGVVSGLVQGVFQSDNTADTSTNRDNSSSKLRKSIEARYASEVNQGSLFRWVTSAELMSENTPLIDEDFVAAAAFWRMASDIVLQQSNNEKEKWYLALPETTSAVASNLCDILNWYANEVEEDASMHVNAQLDSRADDVPIIQFTVTTNVQPVPKQQNDHELPSAADTERQTKAWVTRLLVELGVCPFTKSSQKSGQGLGDMGVPVANIMYRHSDALSCGDGGIYRIMADAWEAISDMVAAGPSGKKGVSSILLSAPGFDEDFALWAGPVFAMLEAGVSAIQAEEIIGVVCFHPKYVVPDGKSWPGFGHMHSLPRLKKWYNQYSSSSAEATTTPLEDDEIAAGGAFQRRTPHAVINVLRAEQLEAAEGRRSTGELYERNIRVLMGKEGGVGLERLTNDLRLEQQI